MRAGLKLRGRQKALVSHERWLVSYADFMTLLFAFFVVLFATAHHSPGALGKLSGAIHSGFSGSSPIATSSSMAAIPVQSAAVFNQNPDLNQLAGELRTVLGDSIEKQEVSLQQTQDGLVISFQELGFFHSGEAAMLPGQAAKIVQAGMVLTKHNMSLRVEGHSDDQPIHNEIFASNWELSAARAMTVLLLLVDQAHYDPTRLSMAGYGAYRPVADNTSAEGRQKNRRVDLVILSGSRSTAGMNPAEGRR